MFRHPRLDRAQLEAAIRLLRAARRIVVLTGAGISTPSGIPDFRSAGTGLWSHWDPLAIASIWSFREKPQRFYEWIRPLARKIVEAQPNAAHFALAELERLGKLHLLITQNIDALHQKAGSQRIVELHGHLRTLTCLQCRFQDTMEGYLAAFLDRGELPLCTRCGAVLKPDVVLFGEPLPDHEIRLAQEEALRCDLMLVVGSSLEVMPAADLPALAVRRGARLIIVNLEPTPYDHLADVVLHADVAKAMPQLVRALRMTEPSVS